jgi:hypothetical protein
MYKFREELFQRKNISYIALTEDEADQMYWLMDRCFQVTSLVDNRYNYPTTNAPVIGRVCEGQKTLSILKKLAIAYDLEDMYEEFRLEHSRILNDKNLHGTFCLSIHPLDYFTMSDNNCGWDSCMSWKNDGCYHSGTIEMMNSRSVVVAYLKSSRDMDMPYGRTWNSKKWRMLYIVDPSCAVVGIKDYPYASEDLRATTMQMVKELFANNNINTDNWFDIRLNCDALEDGEPFHNPITDLDFYASFYTDRMYNDFCCSDYHPAFINSDNTYAVREYNYSGEMVCLKCGRECDYDDISSDESETLCYDCEPGARIHCADCGARIHSDDAIYDRNGAAFCEDCYYNIYARESFYNDEILKEEAVRVAIVPTDTFFIKSENSLQVVSANRFYRDLRIHYFYEGDIDNGALWDRYFNHQPRTTTLRNGDSFTYLLQSDLTPYAIAKGFGYYGNESSFKDVESWLLD